MDANRLLTKQAILIASAIDTVLLIALAILWLLTFTCTNSAASSQGTCAANQPLGGVGAVLIVVVALFFTLLTIEVWLVSLIKTGRARAWAWLVLCLVIPPIGSLLYGIFGPEESTTERPPYIEGTPRTPVTSS